MTNNIWFTSDTHYNHKNICRGISEWKNKETAARDFKDLSEMNQALVNNINAVVGQDDVLYHLGDWSFGGIESIWPFRRRIQCRTVHFIIGNHDKHIKQNLLLPNCITGELTTQDLFESVNNYLEITIAGQIFVLSHYPIEEWYEMDKKGAIMLHGHVHHKFDECELNTKYRRMDVGIDWKEFRPYSLEEIVRIMSKRERKQHSS